MLQTGVCMGCSASLAFIQILPLSGCHSRTRSSGILSCLGGQGLGRAWLRHLAGQPVCSTGSPRCSISTVPCLHSLHIPTCSGSPAVWLCWLEGVTRGSPQPFGHGVVFLKPHLLRHSCMELFFLLSSMTAACWSQASRLTCPWLHLSRK